MGGVQAHGADFSDGDFMGSNFERASFEGAVLRNVSFRGADLTGAHFDENYLIGVDEDPAVRSRDGEEELEELDEPDSLAASLMRSDE